MPVLDGMVESVGFRWWNRRMMGKCGCFSKMPSKLRCFLHKNLILPHTFVQQRCFCYHLWVLRSEFCAKLKFHTQNQHLPKSVKGAFSRTSRVGSVGDFWLCAMKKNSRCGRQKKMELFPKKHQSWANLSNAVVLWNHLVGKRSLLQLIKFMLLAIMGYNSESQIEACKGTGNDRWKTHINFRKMYVANKISHLGFPICLWVVFFLRKVHEIRIFIPRYSEKPQVAAIPTFFGVSELEYVSDDLKQKTQKQPSQHPQIDVLEFCCNTVFLVFFLNHKGFLFSFHSLHPKNPIVCQAARAAMAPGVAGSWCKGVEP